MSSVDHCITFADVQAAASRIAGKAHVTPVLTSAYMDRLAGKNRHVYFKVEALQKTGSFKFRGALNAVSSVIEQQAEAAEPTGSVDKPTFITHSSGNHAQALALAVQMVSAGATIVMPHNCPTVKRQAVQDFGGHVVLVEPTNQARAAKVQEILQTNPHMTFIHPSEDPRVIAGQGTVCLEMVQQVQELCPDNNPPLDAVIIPVGGGGLAAGNIITLRALLGPSVQIILAEPALLDDTKRSFDSKTLLGHAPDNALDSVADGLKTTLGPNTWPIIRDGANAVLTVSEEQILRATKLVWEVLKIAIEPSAGVGVAVLLDETFQQHFAFCSNVGVILCGGNVDIVKMATKMLEKGL